MISVQSEIALAVLIDADNASPKIIEGLLANVATIGNASVRRIYGDWTAPEMAPWKSALLSHSIHPMQQFRYTKGKNATDSAMIIDAMDLLYTRRLDGFCIVSSDSDFTRLASRIRESGKHVYGFGEKKTPSSFVAACNNFIYTEDFLASAGAPPEPRRKTAEELRSDTRLMHLLRSAIEAASNKNGWALLSGVGNNIVKQASDFSTKKYGYPKLYDLAEATGLFEITREEKRVLIKNARTGKSEAAF